jgi:hypothetical protein
LYVRTHGKHNDYFSLGKPTIRDQRPARFERGADGAKGKSDAGILRGEDRRGRFG